MKHEYVVGSFEIKPLRLIGFAVASKPRILRGYAILQCVRSCCAILGVRVCVQCILYQQCILWAARWRLQGVQVLTCQQMVPALACARRHWNASGNHSLALECHRYETHRSGWVELKIALRGTVQTDSGLWFRKGGSCLYLKVKLPMHNIQ